SDRFDMSTQLLDFGFANYKLSKINLDADQITSVKIKNGTVKSIVPVANNSDSILVNKSSGEFEYEYKLKESVEAPVRKGDTLGEVLVMNGNEQVASIALVAECNIKTVTFSYIFNELLKNI
ncbi:MAG: hypothetical protein K2H13_07770, partial [Eubacterium sp.]|nr:hypothetical protein [Eubacterium sp.]